MTVSGRSGKKWDKCIGMNGKFQGIKNNVSFTIMNFKHLNVTVFFDQTLFLKPAVSVSFSLQFVAIAACFGEKVNNMVY